MLPIDNLLLHSFIFTLLILPSITKTQCTEHDKSLLLELKNQLIFNPSVSTILVQWNQSDVDDDCCAWEGVGCDGGGGGRVISLDLQYEGISGGLNESSSLFGLEYLEELDLSYNSMEGYEVPREFHKLKHLTSLTLKHCSLRGYFPEVIFHLPTLRTLDLSQNPLLSGTMPRFSRDNAFNMILLKDTNFSGSLPADSFSNLKSLSYLDLSGCRFSGPVPPTLSNLTRLEYVDLSHNFFSGSISSIRFETLSSVSWMDLCYNSLSGVVPISIFTLPSLWMLKLSNNQFTGQVGEFPTVNISTQFVELDLSSNRLESPIPNSLFYIQSLTYLSLSNNLFNHAFRLENIVSLPKLETLDFSGNNLSLPSSVPSSSNYFRVRQSSLAKLDLSNNRIAGKIPSWLWQIGYGSLVYLNLSCNMLVDLQKPYNIPASYTLYVLDLHSNQLRGEFPSSLLRGAMYVDYSNNRLSGSFPASICNYVSLQYLDLSNNNLSGSTIPPCLFENHGKFSKNCSLVTLDLSNNNLVGELPISLENCRLLQVVNLSNNKLSGTVPAFLTRISVLNLGRNNFTGRIPDFTVDCHLLYLVLSNNNLIGEVPQSVGNCKLLEVMNIGGNYLNGTFPCMLPSSLQVLVLRSNSFHGEVTCRNDKSWPNLQIIDIALNKFSGYLDHFNFSSWRGMTRDTVTKLSYKALDFTTANNWVEGYYREEVTLTIKGVEQKLVKIWPDFTSVDLSNNNFDGDIPDSIGGLDGLYLLNLSHNRLTGTIPKSFGKLRLLGALDLSANCLTGNIPKDIARLTFLAVMNVSYNKLVGEIPVSTQIQSFSADCFQGNAGLCGPPLNISCPNTGRVSPPEQGGEDSEREEIEWGYVFAAAGYTVGLGSFSWLLLFCKSFRYKYFEKVEGLFDTISERCKRRKRRGRGRRVGRNQVTKQ